MEGQNEKFHIWNFSFRKNGVIMRIFVAKKNPRNFRGYIEFQCEKYHIWNFSMVAVFTAQNLDTVLKLRKDEIQALIDSLRAAR